jgi:hypothetical protein
LNIIEYLFCERLFGQVLLIEKSAAEKVRQEKCGRKSAAGKLRQKKCGRKVWQEKCGKKSVAGKVWQKKCGRKSVEEKCGRKRKVWQKKCGGRKSVAEKVRQEKCGKVRIKKPCRKGAEKSRQQNATRRKRYGFHMCSVELMNLVEGFPCKSVGCPLGSLGLVVEWF